MNNRIISVLRIKPFLLLWIAEVLSQVAMNMTNFMLILIVYEITNSNAAVSGVVLSFTVPAILFGIIAGVYVDRWNKKGTLFLTNLLRAFILVLFALLRRNILVAYLLSFCFAIVTQFFIPAETPMIPNLVPEEHLFTANALFGMGVYGSIFIAYALSSPFLIFFGHKNAFFALAIVFLISSIFISMIRIKSGKGRAVVKAKELSISDEVKVIYHLIRKTKTISHSVFLLILSQILVLILAVIGPGYAQHILRIHVDDFPLIFVTPATLGMVAGALIIGNYFHNASRSKMATLGVFLAGVTLILFPYGSRVASRGFVHTLNAFLPHILTINILHIVILLAFIFGFANSLMFVPSNTVLQEETSDNLRGKVYGAMNALVGLSSLFPIILVGSLADTFGIGKVLTWIGITLLLIWLVRVVFRH